MEVNDFFAEYKTKISGYAKELGKEIGDTISNPGDFFKGYFSDFDNFFQKKKGRYSLKNTLYERNSKDGLDVFSWLYCFFGGTILDGIQFKLEDLLKNITTFQNLKCILKPHDENKQDDKTIQLPHEVDEQLKNIIKEYKESQNDAKWATMINQINKYNNLMETTKFFKTEVGKDIKITPETIGAVKDTPLTKENIDWLNNNWKYIKGYVDPDDLIKLLIKKYNEIAVTLNSQKVDMDFWNVDNYGKLLALLKK